MRVRLNIDGMHYAKSLNDNRDAEQNQPHSCLRRPSSATPVASFLAVLTVLTICLFPNRFWDNSFRSILG